MPRSIWKGSIAFGLVNIPVSLTSAESRPDIQLHMVDSSNHARIRYERVNADTGEEVPWDRMVKGYEHEDGKFILLSEAELDAVEPKLTKTIEISEFVALSDIDPILFDKPYYLEPDKRGKKAYVLLREALRKSDKAGLSRVVIRTREYLCAVFVRGDVLLLMLLRFPQEVRDVAEMDLPSADVKEWKPVKKEMDLAMRLIDDMTEKWNPEEVHDEYREALMAYIENKLAKGETVTDVREGDGDGEKSDGKILDLAAYLERSVKKVSEEKAATKKTAKKNAPKKAARKDVAKQKPGSKSRRSA